MCAASARGRPGVAIFSTGAASLAGVPVYILLARKFDITDAFALAALRAIAFRPSGNRRPRTAKMSPRIQTALNATALSGLTYGNSWLGIGHSVCHSLGGRYGLSHGAANAVMVRHSLRFNFEAAKPRLAVAARAVGVSSDADNDRAANALVDAVDALARTLGTPTQLRSIGLPDRSVRADRGGRDGRSADLLEP